MSDIVIVEDNRHQRLLLTEELEEEGYTVHAVATGREALSAVATVMPDLVILDIAMPGMDGIELLGKLLSIDSTLPVVLYTAYSSYKDSFMAWSANAYVIKQSDATELKSTIREILTEGEAHRPMARDGQSESLSGSPPDRPRN